MPQTKANGSKNKTKVSNAVSKNNLESSNCNWNIRGNAHKECMLTIDRCWVTLEHERFRTRRTRHAVAPKVHPPAAPKNGTQKQHPRTSKNGTQKQHPRTSKNGSRDIQERHHQKRETDVSALCKRRAKKARWKQWNTSERECEAIPTEDTKLREGNEPRERVPYSPDQ